MRFLHNSNCTLTGFETLVVFAGRQSPGYARIQRQKEKAFRQTMMPHFHRTAVQESRMAGTACPGCKLVHRTALHSHEPMIPPSAHVDHLRVGDFIMLHPLDERAHGDLERGG